jgi:hypothetical protein
MNLEDSSVRMSQSEYENLSQDKKNTATFMLLQSIDENVKKKCVNCGTRKMARILWLALGILITWMGWLSDKIYAYVGGN